jgi:nitroreductase
MSASSKHVPLAFVRRPVVEMRDRASAWADEAERRRSVRHFSSEPVPLDVVRECVRAAASAPSGANKQPWTFVLVTDPDVKRRIRASAEAEERAFYGGRAPQRWLDDLGPFGTGPEKPFLEVAPALIVVFAQKHGERPDERHYYVQESVGLATGMLLAALHRAGLATLTHTPSPMRFLSEVLNRPERERPFLLIPVGYPAGGCRVPDIARKPLSDVLVEVGAAPGAGGSAGQEHREEDAQPHEVDTVPEVDP